MTSVWPSGDHAGTPPCRDASTGGCATVAPPGPPNSPPTPAPRPRPPPRPPRPAVGLPSSARPLTAAAGHPHRIWPPGESACRRRARCRAPRPDAPRAPASVSRASRGAGAGAAASGSSRTHTSCSLPASGRDRTRRRRTCRSARRSRLPFLGVVGRQLRRRAACRPPRSRRQLPRALRQRDGRRRGGRRASRRASARRRPSTSRGARRRPSRARSRVELAVRVGAERDRLAVGRPAGSRSAIQPSGGRRRRASASLAVGRHRPDHVEPADGEPLAVWRPGGFADAGADRRRGRRPRAGLAERRLGGGERTRLAREGPSSDGEPRPTITTHAAPTCAELRRCA